MEGTDRLRPHFNSETAFHHPKIEQATDKPAEPDHPAPETRQPPKVQDAMALSPSLSNRLERFASEPRVSNDLSQSAAKCVTGNSVKSGTNTTEGVLAGKKNGNLAVEYAGDCGAGNIQHDQAVLEDQDDVFRSLPTAELKAAFEELTPSEREDFCSIYRAVAPNDPSDANDAGQVATSALQVLLSCNGLDEVDINGNTLLETLGAAAGKELSPELKGVDKQEALQSLVAELANTAIYQGEGTDTCASATMQSLMASSMPGEYARIATALLFEGEATVQFGKQVKVATDELPKNDGRNDFDKVMQGSFAAFARTFPGEGEEFAGRGGGGGTSRGDETSSGRGLTDNQVREMYYHLTGNNAAVAQVTDTNLDQLFTDMSAAVQAGLYIPVGLDFDGADDNQGHAVTVVGVGVDGVTYVDSLDMQKKTMPEQEFKKRMSLDGMVVLPQEYAQGIAVVEKPEGNSAMGFFARLADHVMGQWGYQNPETTVLSTKRSMGRGNTTSTAR